MDEVFLFLNKANSSTLVLDVSPLHLLLQSSFLSPVLSISPSPYWLSVQTWCYSLLLKKNFFWPHFPVQLPLQFSVPFYSKTLSRVVYTHCFPMSSRHFFLFHSMRLSHPHPLSPLRLFLSGSQVTFRLPNPLVDSQSSHYMTYQELWHRWWLLPPLWYTFFTWLPA